jgi:hypothetical protein
MSANISSEAAAEPTHTLFWPLVVLVTALLIWFGFQFTQIMTDRSNLSAVHQQQEVLVQNAAKLTKAADTLALGTLQLANQGNPNAKLVVDKLARRGISINRPQ